jgi:hypothetical protein
MNLRTAVEPLSRKGREGRKRSQRKEEDWLEFGDAGKFIDLKTDFLKNNQGN